MAAKKNGAKVGKLAMAQSQLNGKMRMMGLKSKPSIAKGFDIKSELSSIDRQYARAKVNSKVRSLAGAIDAKKALVKDKAKFQATYKAKVAKLKKR